MNEEIKQAQETLQELSSLALKYLINNFHFVNEEYVERKSQISNLTEKIRISLNNFYGYKDSQQDLIKGKDEYIAKLCNDRAELKEQLKQVEDFKHHYDRYKEKVTHYLKVINCMHEEATTNYNLIEQLEDRNDRLVERLEKQKAELKELKDAWEKGILKDKVICNVNLHYYLSKTNEVYSKLTAISNDLERHHIQSVITIGNHWGECWEFFAKGTTTLEIAEYICNFIHNKDLYAKIGYDDNHEFYLSA